MNTTKEQLKLEDSLFLTLFEDTSSKIISFSRRNGIVIKPINIWPILEDLSQSTTSRERQHLIIFGIKEILEHCPLNAITLLKAVNSQGKDILTFLLENILQRSFLEAAEEIVPEEEWIKIIRRLTKFAPLQRAYFQTIFRFLADGFYQNTIKAEGVQLSCRLLQQLIKRQIPNQDEPQSFFYFSKVEAGLRFSQNYWPFTNGFALAFWIYIEDTTDLTDPQARQILFSFHANEHAGIEAYLIKRQLFYTILGPNHTTQAGSEILLGELKEHEWYFIGIEHEKPKTFGRSSVSIIINREAPRNFSIELPKISKDAILTRSLMFHNFTGRVASIINFKSTIGPKLFNSLLQSFPHGIQTQADAKGLSSFLEKFKDRIYSVLTPIRSSSTIAHDACGENPAQLLANSDCWLRLGARQKLWALGGITSFLPLVYLIRFCSSEKQPSVLLDILKVLIVLFKGKPENQYDAFRQGFFKTIGQLLREVEGCALFTRQNIEALAELRQAITDNRLADQFFVHVLWNVDIIMKGDTLLQAEMWKFLRTIYIRNPTLYVSLFTVENILYVGLKHYEQKIGVSCCYAHKNPKNQQGIVIPPFLEENQEPLDLETKLRPLLDIIEAVFMTGGEKVGGEIVSILCIFALPDISPCFLILLFKLLKKLLIDNHNENAQQLYLKCFVHAKAIEVFLALFEATTHFEVKTWCLKFLGFLTNLTRPKKETQTNVSILTTEDLVANKIMALISKQTEAILQTTAPSSQPLPPIKEEPQTPIVNEQEQHPQPPTEVVSQKTTEVSSTSVQAKEELKEEEIVFTLPKKKATKKLPQLTIEDPPQPAVEKKPPSPPPPPIAPPADQVEREEKEDAVTLDLPPIKKPPSKKKFPPILETTEEVVAPVPPPSAKEFPARLEKQEQTNPFEDAPYEPPKGPQAPSMSNKRKPGGALFSKSNVRENNIFKFGEKPEETKTENKSGSHGGSLRLDSDLQIKPEDEAFIDDLFAGGKKGISKDPNEDRLANTMGGLSEEMKKDDNELTLTLPKAKTTAKVGKGKGNKFTNLNLALSIDTDAINANYTYGGEKGQQKDVTDKWRQQFDEITDLAGQCVRFLRGELIKENRFQAQQRNLVEVKDAAEEDDVVMAPLPPSVRKTQPNFNQPQTMRGIKTISFEKPPAEENPPKKEQNLPPVKEHSMSIGSNDEKENSISSKENIAQQPNNSGKIPPTVDKGGSLNAKQNTHAPFLVSPKSVEPVIPLNSQKSPLNKSGHIMAPSLTDAEAYYFSLLEWALGRPPLGYASVVIIDEGSYLSSVQGFDMLMQFASNCCPLPELRIKVLHDLHLLMKVKANCYFLCNSQLHDKFILWLYDNLLQAFEHLTKPVWHSIWECGLKIHTLYHETILSGEIDSYKKLEILNTWLRKGQQYEKPKEIALIARVAMSNLFATLTDQARRLKPTLLHIFWKNLVASLSKVQEMIILGFRISRVSSLTPIKDEFIDPSLEETNLPKKIGEIGEANMFQEGDFLTNLQKYVSTVRDESTGLHYEFGFFNNTLRLFDVLWPQNDNIQSLMKRTSSPEFIKLLDIFLFSSKEQNFFARQYVTILLINIEMTDRLKDEENLKMSLDLLVRCLKSLILAAENARDRKDCEAASNKIADLSLLALTYICIKIVNVSTNFKKLFKEVESDFTRFLYSVFDHVSKEIDFQSFLDKGTTKQNHSPLNQEGPSLMEGRMLVVFEIFGRHLTDGKGEPLFARMNERKKSQEIEAVGSSEKWIQFFVDNDKQLGVYSRIFEDIRDEVISSIISSDKYGPSGSPEYLKFLEDSKLAFGEELTSLVTKVKNYLTGREQQIKLASEVNVRTCRSLWKKFWKKLRLFVELWVPSSFTAQYDTPFDFEAWDYFKTEANPLFEYKVCKLEVKSKARPFLKLRLKEPMHAQNDTIRVNNLFKCKIVDVDPLLLHNGMPLPEFLKVGQIISKYLDLQVSLAEGQGNSGTLISQMINFFGISPAKPPTQVGGQAAGAGGNTYNPKDQEKDTVSMFLKCEIIKSMTIQPGFLHFTPSKLVFTLDSVRTITSHLSIRNTVVPQDKKLTKEWHLDHIREIMLRRYLLQRKALEFFFVDGSSVFIHFAGGKTELEHVIATFTRLKKTAVCPNLRLPASLEPEHLFDSSNLTKKWLNHEISTFDYLMGVNNHASRNYLDISQYPIFPWILSNYHDEKIDLGKEENYRDLTKTMGNVGSPDRIQVYQERYENFDQMGIPQFHFGSHYSSPGIVLFYLVRVSPFTEGAIALQGGRFDLPDRLFMSIEDTWRNATHEIADVRELIPEFYTMPEMLINLNHLNLGRQQNGAQVGHVRLPEWALKNPFLFTTIMRKSLETPTVSKYLSAWLDLKFGIKQRGPEAERNLNRFYYLTYEGLADLDNEKDQETRVAMESQIMHFGQTPIKLFAEPHPERKTRDSVFKSPTIGDEHAEFKVYRPTARKIVQEENDEVLKYSGLPDKAFVSARFCSENKLIGLMKDGTYTTYRWINLPSLLSEQIRPTVPFILGIERGKSLKLFKDPLQDCLDLFDKSCEIPNLPVVLLNQAKIIILGGLWDGALHVIVAESNEILERYYIHTDTVTTICADSKDNFVITGSRNGEVFVWRISKEWKLSVKYQYYHHHGTVHSVFLSSDLRLFASAGEDGTVNLYHIFSGEFFRSFRHPNGHAIRNVALASTPIACVIMYSSQDTSIYCYSINGFLLTRVQEPYYNMLSPVIMKDINFMDLLVYGNEKGEILIRETPFLEVRNRATMAKNQAILSCLSTKDRIYLLTACADGEFSILCDPRIMINTKDPESQVGNASYS